MSEWDKIVGHKWATDVLAGAIEHDNVGHAYLITGPSHVGKTLLAQTFAMALNCTGEGARPCGMCRSCTLIVGNKHPDVMLVEPELSPRGKPSIKIEAMRDLQKSLQLGTLESRYKVAIITQFDSANLNAANAFLKTLEEPPRNVILLLTASEADALLDTIKSRCRVVGIRPIPTPTIQQALVERWRIPSDLATLLAHLATGRLGWAVTAASAPDLLAQRDADLALLKEALGGSRIGRFKLADKLARKPETLPRLLQTWLSWWRDIMLIAHGQATAGTIANIDESAILQQHATAWGREVALRSLRQTQDALWQLERNANTKLVIENLLLVYPHVESATQ